MTDREAFEAWSVRANPMYTPGDDNIITRRDWEIWQAAKATAPAWKDAPTAAGLWLNSINGRARQVSNWNIAQEIFKDGGARWFGPIPQQTGE